MHRSLQKVIEYCFAALFFATPLIMFHKTSELFEFNKLLFIYAVTSIILASWIGKMLIQRTFIFKKSLLTYPLVAFFLTQLLSTIFSIDPHTSIFGYYGRFNGGLLSTASYCILFFAFISNISTDTFLGKKNTIQTLFKITLYSSLIVVLWGMPGKFGYDLTCLLFTGTLGNGCWTQQFHPEERMFSTLGQPNWLGAYLVISFFMSLYLLYKNQSDKRVSLLISSYLILIFSAIFFTKSRSSIGALFIGLLVIGFFFYTFKSTLKTKLFHYLFAFFFFITILFRNEIPFIARMLPTVQSKIASKNAQVEVKEGLPAGGTESFDIRKIVWRGSIDLLKKYYVFGTGVETFAYSYYFVRPIEHNATSEWDFVYNKAHNEFLNIAATGGLINILAYFWLIASTCYLMIRKFLFYIKNDKKSKESAFLIVCVSSAYIAILITNFFGFATTVISLYFYLLVGFVILMESNEITHTKSKEHKLGLLGLLPALIVVSGTIFVIRYISADMLYARAESEMQAQRFDMARSHLETAQKLKYEHVYEDKLSSVYANMALFASLDTNPQLDQIQTYLTKAQELNENTLIANPKNVFYWKTRAKNEYIIYQLTSEKIYYDSSIDSLVQAQKLAPTDPRLPYTQALFMNSYSEQDKNASENLVRALAYSNKAIQLKSNYRDGYFIKGQILKKMGRKDDARKAFEYIITKIHDTDEEVDQELKAL